MSDDESPPLEQPRPYPDADPIMLFDREALAEQFDDPDLLEYANRIVDRVYRGIVADNCSLDRDDAVLLLNEADAVDGFLLQNEKERILDLENRAFEHGRPDGLGFAELCARERAILEIEQRALHRYREYQAELDEDDDDDEDTGVTLH